MLDRVAVDTAPSVVELRGCHKGPTVGRDPIATQGPRDNVLAKLAELLR